jgi:5-methylcytosine-specific restriction endonuclease McrA
MQPVPFEHRKPAEFAHRALRKSLRAEENARQCAVLWFGEIMRRKLYRELGYSSINRYARQALGFSKTRTGDAENERAWVNEAVKSSRRELETKVAAAKQKAAKSGQPSLMPVPALPKASPPVRVSVEMTPEQLARYEKLMEALAKRGQSGDRAALLLEGLAALANTEKAPRGAPFQVHIHECPACEAAHVATGKGELAVDQTTKQRAHCDSHIAEPGRRNKATIPPAVRRLVLARDRHTCRTPGCTHSKFLEVHHVVPRVRGGGNDPKNLVTLCSACHRLVHEKPGAMAALAGG